MSHASAHDDVPAGAHPQIAPPDGTNWIVTIRYSMTMALLSTMFASFLVPMLIALFFFAAQHACRRTRVFWFNAGALALGIVEAIYLVSVQVRSALHPPIPDDLLLIWYIMSFFTPIFVESILIFRLAAVYSPETTSPRRRKLIIGFPIVWKFVRFANLVALLVVWQMHMKESGVPIESGLMGWGRFCYPKIAWGMQILDNCFCSVAFLRRLHTRIWQSTRLTTSLPRQRSRQMIIQQLKSIFVIALSNFLIPTSLGIAHLIIALLHDQWANPTWMYICSYIMIVNNYLSIIGVVFATIWATSREWAGNKSHGITDASFFSQSPTSSRTATGSINLPFTPKSGRSWGSPFSSQLPTPISPEFAMGRNSRVITDEQGATILTPSRQNSLRINVTKDTSKKYEIEVGKIIEDEVDSPELSK